MNGVTPGKSDGQGAVPGEGPIQEAQFKLNLSRWMVPCVDGGIDQDSMQVTDTQPNQLSWK